MPWLGAGLPNIDSVGAGREQSPQLIVLFPVGGIHIDVRTQLAGLGLVSLAEDDRGLRAAEADARRPDLMLASSRSSSTWPSTSHQNRASRSDNALSLIDGEGAGGRPA